MLQSPIQHDPYHIRDRPMHNQDQFDSLCIELEHIWSSIVNPFHSNKSPSQNTLGTVYITGGILIALEAAGFIVPKPGKEKEWTLGNLEVFERKAREGDKHIAGLLEEL
ncbi:hypothetical protein BP6252_13685 [Coleophoma cylindrospora]|uniref:Uncharacterized protein n=1 Tax=Coleophoma cylindrospora TaxID=1849047 RepID=A0A3D8Q714_9HELO|nr:hypothetical protein BP6252_13685 [Coleophoma cylindrospora]